MNLNNMNTYWRALKYSVLLTRCETMLSTAFAGFSVFFGVSVDFYPLHEDLWKYASDVLVSTFRDMKINVLKSTKPFNIEQTNEQSTIAHVEWEFSMWMAIWSLSPTLGADESAHRRADDITNIVSLVIRTTTNIADIQIAFGCGCVCE